MGRSKSRLVVDFEYVAAVAVLMLVRLLPLTVCYMCARGMARLWFLLDGRHRERTISHLLHAGVASSRPEAVGLAKQTFAHLFMVAVEIMKGKQFLTLEATPNLVGQSGPEEALATIFPDGDPKQLIIVSAHFGNWELGGSALVRLSGRPMVTVERPLDNPKVGAFVVSERGVPGHRVVQKQGALRALLKALREGESVCLLADQHASTGEGVVTTFFGHPARTHMSPALLHLKTGVPIVVVCCKRIDSTPRFELVCRGPICVTPSDDRDADRLRVTQMYTAAIEEIIREDPGQWLWMHRRWLDINRKTAPPPAPEAPEAP